MTSTGTSDSQPARDERRYSEQGETYDVDLIADLEAKAERWKSKPWGCLLAEAAARLKVLSPVVERPPNIVRDPSRAMDPR
jgi:hypothetical protein